MSTGSATWSRCRWLRGVGLALWGGLVVLSAPALARDAEPVGPAASPVGSPPASSASPAAPPLATPDASAAAAASPIGDSGSSRPDALRDVDRRVGDLKDQIFRAKARLSLLSERHLRSSAGGVVTTVSQRNQLGALYRLVRVTYEIDGREVFRREEEAGKPIPSGDLSIWDGPLRPGEHTLSTTFLYRGNGRVVFAYYDQYTYTVTAAHRFSVSEGTVPRIRVVCREKGSFATTSLENRPLIEFVADDSPAQKPTGGKGADASR